jgi:hypothetical protein
MERGCRVSLGTLASSVFVAQLDRPIHSFGVVLLQLFVRVIFALVSLKLDCISHKHVCIFAHAGVEGKTGAGLIAKMRSHP